MRAHGAPSYLTDLPSMWQFCHARRGPVWWRPRHNTAYFDMPVNTYSAGMRARLAFGACLAIDFDSYLIDEVTETGDERFRRKCALAFRERMQRSDIILVTHNSRTIRQYCDRAAVLADGELRLYDDVASALADYRRHIAMTGETVQ
jgi:capsular polysaccharide transport system ATP-binding protein